MSIAIKVENLSKAYQLGEIGTGTISRDLERWLAKIRGKEDPFLKVGVVNDRTLKGKNDDVVWSLKDINFAIEQGDAVGIIGRNGAGKSTLLKVLSRVTSPTAGRISGTGRIASLLEVGTGFHPELTGRENIFLNGAILGMRKKEIRRKFDEIVAFAGVERYIGTPVKRYSSGMYVRLAFAVAAHLESEVLIVDEVLAVGDAEFQKKCLGKMGEVSKGEGRTVLFVSHNMGSIRNLCSEVILLQNGQLLLKDSSDVAIKKYGELNSNFDAIGAIKTFEIQSSKKAQLLHVALKDDGNKVCNEFDINSDIYIEIEYVINALRGGISIAIDLYRKDDHVFRSYDSDLRNELLEPRKPGKYKTIVKLPKYLKGGEYKVNFHIGILRVEALDTQNDALSFNVVENSIDTTYKSFSAGRPGIIRSELIWENYDQNI